MERKRTLKVRPDDISERQIVIGLITSTEYLKQIQEVWNIEYIESTTAKLISSWVWEYFNKYGEAPGKLIETIYYQKLKEGKLQKDIAEDIEDSILPSLSAEFESTGTNEYLIDQTVKHFKSRHLKIQNEKIEALVQSGQIEEAEKIVKDFKPLEIVTTSKLNPFTLSIDEIKEEQLVTPRVLMSPWLREGEFTFIYGDAGCGKSWLAISIAYLLGLETYNEPEHEIGEWQVKSPTGCLYVDGELGLKEMVDRIRQFEWLGKQGEDTKIRPFTIPEYQLVTEDTFMLSERQNQLQIIQWLREHPTYKLLILDSVTTLFGLTEENSNSEWNNKINPFLRDLRALGVACILLHHSGKNQKQGLRGASSMGAMIHNTFKLTNHPDKDIDEGEAWFTLSKDKQRSGGFSFKKFAIHYSQDSSFSETHWEISDAGDIKKEELNIMQIRIIRRLIQGHKQVKIAEYLGVKPPYINQVKKKAVDLGYLRPDGTPTPLWDSLIDRFKNSGETGEE